MTIEFVLGTRLALALKLSFVSVKKQLGPLLEFLRNISALQSTDVAVTHKKRVARTGYECDNLPIPCGHMRAILFAREESLQKERMVLAYGCWYMGEMIKCGVASRQRK